MIIGIGCDIVDHQLTHRLGWSSNLKKMQRIFSLKELEIFELCNADRFLSGRFAAKEAVLKSVGTGMKDGISLTDIQVLQDEMGKPFIQVDGEVKKIAESLGIIAWHVSISHNSENSIAFVIAESA